jgi:hypothetical protein
MAASERRRPRVDTIGNLPATHLSGASVRYRPLSPRTIASQESDLLNEPSVTVMWNTRDRQGADHRRCLDRALVVRSAAVQLGGLNERPVGRRLIRPGNPFTAWWRTTNQPAGRSLAITGAVSAAYGEFETATVMAGALRGAAVHFNANA